MEKAMIFWYVVVGIVLGIFVFQYVEYALSKHGKKRKHSSSHHHIVELGKERDMFFVPGDD